jgi:hypothetical protein
MMDGWSNGEVIADSRKPKYSEKKLFQCHFVDHTADIDCPETETYQA